MMMERVGMDMVMMDRVGMGEGGQMIEIGMEGTE